MADIFADRKKALHEAAEMADEPIGAPASRPAEGGWQRKGYYVQPAAPTSTTLPQQRTDAERERQVREKAAGGKVLTQEDL